MIIYLPVSDFNSQRDCSRLGKKPSYAVHIADESRGDL